MLFKCCWGRERQIKAAENDAVALNFENKL